MANPHTIPLPDELATLLPRLSHMAHRLTRTPEDAADLAQDAALRLWQQYQTATPIEDPQALAMTILRNLARSHWRRHREFDPLEDDMLATPPDALRVLACNDIEAAIDRLPETHATLLHHVERGETSPATLAKLTGVPVGTIMSRLARARASLRKEMGLSRECSVTSLYQETS